MMATPQALDHLLFGVDFGIDDVTIKAVYADLTGSGTSWILVSIEEVPGSTDTAKFPVFRRIEAGQIEGIDEGKTHFIIEEAETF